MAEKKLREAAQEYIEHLKSLGKNERTTFCYNKDLEQIQTFFSPERRLTAILPPHVCVFLKSDALLKTNGKKDRAEVTIRRTLRVLRMFLIWAREQGYVVKLPLPKSFPMGRDIKDRSEVTNEHANGPVAVAS